MANIYQKIGIYEACKFIIVGILILCAFIAGRYFWFSNSLGIIVALVLNVLGVTSLFYIEKYINKQTPYKKGLKLENQMAEKLKRLDIKYKSNIDLKYGDLDLYVENKGKYYGIEVKNYSGVVSFDNDLLIINGWDNTDILSKLLRHCGLARDIELGKDSGKWINPVLVFGYGVTVQIPQNKIIFHNKEIIVATIKDFEKYIK